MIKLADLVHGRNNNFHLLRLLAASAVLFSHAFPLSTGDRLSEPLRKAFGLTPGSVAVDLFFLISGLLVTISLLRRQSAIDFIKARFFRIWPGLTVAILLTVFVLGPVFTTVSWHDYFFSRVTLKYVIKNLLLVTGVVYTLPGMFAHLPWKSGINGSLWTLPAEIRCYLCLLASWVGMIRLGRPDWLRLGIGALWLALLASHLYAMLVEHKVLEDSPTRLYFMFCTGAAFYVFRSSVRLSWTALAVAVAALILASPLPIPFELAYTFAVPYIAICLAYLPTGPILGFNRLGDYSYGTYIYAFPVQQTLMAVFLTLTPTALFLASLPVTLILAVLSWHFIEEPASKLARRAAPKPPAYVASPGPL